MNKSKGKVVKTIRTIPIDEIRFLNPRVRNRRNFQEIVQNIAKVARCRHCETMPSNSSMVTT
jgi:ParB family transcriptional regulator, chromosome partitioning protein